jgi:LysM repeat protein
LLLPLTLTAACTTPAAKPAASLYIQTVRANTDIIEQFRTISSALHISPTVAALPAKVVSPLPYPPAIKAPAEARREVVEVSRGKTTATAPSKASPKPTGTAAKPPATPAPSTAAPAWPAVTYIVKPGETPESIGAKFGVSPAAIMKYNYMTGDDYLFEGDKIAISGYAPRLHTVTPGEDAAPKRVGHLVDWVYEGQYLIKPGNVVTIVDQKTGKQFRMRMMGGYNHADMETVTAADTATMKSVFGGIWTWIPRPVVVFRNGMNIAASLSAMPHSFDTIAGNNMSGHVDMYLYHSKPHAADTDTTYQAQHAAAVLKAAGR